MTKELQELRREIKPLGYKLKTKALSWGRHLTYVHIESKEEFTFNVYASKEQLERWAPLVDYLGTVPTYTKLMTNDGERVYGSSFSGEDKQ